MLDNLPLRLMEPGKFYLNCDGVVVAFTKEFIVNSALVGALVDFPGDPDKCYGIVADLEGRWSVADAHNDPVVPWFSTPYEALTAFCGVTTKKEGILNE